MSHPTGHCKEYEGGNETNGNNEDNCVGHCPNQGKKYGIVSDSSGTTSFGNVKYKNMWQSYTNNMKPYSTSGSGSARPKVLANVKFSH